MGCPPGAALARRPQWVLLAPATMRPGSCCKPHSPQRPRKPAATAGGAAAEGQPAGRPPTPPAASARALNCHPSWQCRATWSTSPLDPLRRATTTAHGGSEALAKAPTMPLDAGTRRQTAQCPDDMLSLTNNFKHMMMFCKCHVISGAASSVYDT